MGLLDANHLSSSNPRVVGSSPTSGAIFCVIWHCNVDLWSASEQCSVCKRILHCKVMCDGLTQIKGQLEPKHCFVTFLSYLTIVWDVDLTFEYHYCELECDESHKSFLKKSKIEQVLPRFELGSLDSESRVLTITPQGHLHGLGRLICYDWKENLIYDYI